MSVHVTNTAPGAVGMTTISAGNDEFSLSTTGGTDLLIFVWHGVFSQELLMCVTFLSYFISDGARLQAYLQPGGLRHILQPQTAHN
jgi:hypothetical protein